MDTSFIFIIFMGIAVVIFFVVSNRTTSKGRNVCNRCSGTGEIDERWPDPDKPGGWHRAEGTCPKCKGKGRF